MLPRVYVNFGHFPPALPMQVVILSESACGLGGILVSQHYVLQWWALGPNSLGLAPKTPSLIFPPNKPVTVDGFGGHAE